jgi:hypothetical protein
LDVSSAYEIDESSWGRRRRDGPTVLVLRLNLLLLPLDHWLDFFGYRRRGEILPQRSGNMDLVARSEDGDRLIGFRARLKNGRYNVSTAYVLDPGQLERMKADAARAGATVLELSSRDHRTGQGLRPQRRACAKPALRIGSWSSSSRIWSVLFALGSHASPTASSATRYATRARAGRSVLSDEMGTDSFAEKIPNCSRTREHRSRPHRRTPEEREELATLHSITSSARSPGLLARMFVRFSLF